MTPRPTEVKAVLALLEQPHDDVRDLAKLLIQTVDELRAERDTYVLATRPFPAGHPVLYGPFATSGQAQRFTKKLVAPGPDPMDWGVFVVHPQAAPNGGNQ